MAKVEKGDLGSLVEEEMEVVEAEEEDLARAVVVEEVEEMVQEDEGSVVEAEEDVQRVEEKEEEEEEVEKEEEMALVDWDLGEEGVEAKMVKVVKEMAVVEVEVVVPATEAVVADILLD